MLVNLFLKRQSGRLTNKAGQVLCAIYIANILVLRIILGIVPQFAHVDVLMAFEAVEKLAK